MNATQYPTIAALFAIGSLFCGCASSGDETLVGLSVSGLGESKTFDACTEQTLKVVSNSSTDEPATYTWNVSAPANASYTSAPNADELKFVARTPGLYLISVTECRATETDCAVTEFAVTVETGADLDANGVGDLCEAASCAPACDGRTCGLDPICQKSCGTCTGDQACNEEQGQCNSVCEPACGGRKCGVDPVCGQSCGSCNAGETCDEEQGQCKATCVPACDGRTCGFDPICHTSCGTCGEGTSCNAEGKCEADGLPGRVVTIVMALTDRRLAFADPHFNQRSKLIGQTVQWVSPTENPKVLVVLDDVTADWSHEAQLIRSTLVKRGVSATLINEPARGLRPEQLEGFDVLWFTNPALPIDDKQSIATMKEFALHGGGLVLQGDDITQPSELEPLTRLHNVSTGKYYCGQYIDDDRGASYKVTVERVKHPVTAGLLGNTYYYGDDIDSSTLIPDTKSIVLAWAQVGGCAHDGRQPSKCRKQPVIVAYDLSE